MCRPHPKTHNYIIRREHFLIIFPKLTICLLIACGGTGISTEGISSSSCLISVLMPSTLVAAATVLIVFVVVDTLDNGNDVR